MSDPAAPPAPPTTPLPAPLRQLGRVAIVTGGAGGIGAATCRRLAADGAAVVVLGLDERSAVDLAATLPHGGWGVQCDITDRAAVAATVAAVLERYGRIDILVNNAGMLRNAPFLEMDPDSWDAVVASNLTGPFTMTQAVAGVMKAQGYGRIVFVSSLAALGNPGQSNYSSAKAGLGGLARTIALELGPHGVTANVVAPGFIATAMMREGLVSKGVDPDEFEVAQAQRSAVRRIGRPDDIAEVVAFFALAESGFVTGQTLYATGNPSA